MGCLTTGWWWWGADLARAPISDSLEPPMKLRIRVTGGKVTDIRGDGVLVHPWFCGGMGVK